MIEENIKKIKIYKLASEINISSETIIEYLNKKGHSIKNIMSYIEPEVLREVLHHFKKDKEVADRHQRKVEEFKDSHKKSVEKIKDIPKPKVEEKPIEIQPEKIIEPKAEDKVEEKVKLKLKIISKIELPDFKTAAPKTAEKIVIPVETENESPKKKVGTEVTVEKIVEVVKVEPIIENSKVEKHVSAKDTAQRTKKIGLKIKGKLELPAPKPVTSKSSAKPDSQDSSIKKKKKLIVHSQNVIQKKEVIDEPIKTKKKKIIKGAGFSAGDVKVAIKKTLSGDDDASFAIRAKIKRNKKKEKEEEKTRIEEASKIEDKSVVVTEFVTVGELANLMRVSATEVISKCFALGMMVSINQRLDKDNIVLVADEFGFEIKFQEEFTVESLNEKVDLPEELEKRPPIVTIMGHVDHGKTSLLDYIRQTNVVAGESGGITQHIGAYEVTIPSGEKITFLDTPGHEAFTAMRARGAQLTDIVILVVSADDSVMPQTIEAINHAKAANVPIIIAITKVDKPDANIEKVKKQLSDRGVLIEEWGGKYQSVEVSAKTGKNIDQLLEKILLEAEILDLKANPNRNSVGVVVEAKVDKGKGITATVLVQKGTLKIGDSFIAGIFSGRVKAMYDERGSKILAAGPASPVQLLGFDGIPSAGDQFVVMELEQDAREISLKRQQLKREQDFRQINFITLDDISQQIKSGKNIKELSILVKGDTDGSVEALSGSLLKISTEEVKIRVIHKGVGQISESDVLLATASKAIIIGFHVRPNLNARKIAEKEKIEIRHYTIIYDAINDLKNALEGLLEPTQVEKIVATVEIRDIFKVPKVGVVAGCYVLDGTVVRNNKIRLVRDGEVLYTGNILALKRFKDDVREVQQNYECGLSIENYNDLKVGDIIESFKIEELKRKL